MSRSKCNAAIDALHSFHFTLICTLAFFAWIWGAFFVHFGGILIPRPRKSPTLLLKDYLLCSRWLALSSSAGIIIAGTSATWRDPICLLALEDGRLWMLRHRRQAMVGHTHKHTRGISLLFCDVIEAVLLSGMFRCGPASVAAVKNGQICYPFDAPFVFAEVMQTMWKSLFAVNPWGTTAITVSLFLQVNSDVVFYHRRKDGTLDVAKVNQTHVGRMVLTKAVLHNGRRDITNQYKFPEG